MQALDSTGFVVGVQMGLAMQQVFGELAAQLDDVMAKALAALVGGDATGDKAPPAPQVARVRADLVAAITHERTTMKIDPGVRETAARRLTAEQAAAIVAGAHTHLAGLPDITAGPLGDQQAADYLSLAIAQDPRWAAWMGVVMPIMQEITGPEQPAG